MDSRPTLPTEALPTTTRTRPESCSSLWINFVGLAGFFASLFALPRLGLDPVDGTVITACATFLPIIALDLLVKRVHRRPTTGIAWDQVPARSWSRLALKLAGLTGTEHLGPGLLSGL